MRESKYDAQICVVLRRDDAGTMHWIRWIRDAVKQV
jgi:hypothetical protein